MNRIAIALLSLSMGASLLVVAHEGHEHDEEPVTRAEAGSIADTALIGLVKNKEIDASWQGRKRTATREQRIAGKIVFVSTYDKPTVDGKGKDTLYIFIDAVGNYIEANSTGKL
jgi:hypothetical protein